MRLGAKPTCSEAKFGSWAVDPNVGPLIPTCTIPTRTSRMQRAKGAQKCWKRGPVLGTPDDEHCNRMVTHRPLSADTVVNYLNASEKHIPTAHAMTDEKTTRTANVTTTIGR